MVADLCRIWCGSGRVTYILAFRLVRMVVNHLERPDDAGVSECSQAPVDLAGLVIHDGTSLVYETGALSGVPDSFQTGGYQATLDSLGLWWEIYDDPTFTPTFEDRWPDGSVRATTNDQWLTWASDVHTFCPLMTHESPSRSARVFTLARSLPASGSL